MSIDDALIGVDETGNNITTWHTMVPQNGQSTVGAPFAYEFYDNVGHWDLNLVIVGASPNIRALGLFIPSYTAVVVSSQPIPPELEGQEYKLAVMLGDPSGGGGGIVQVVSDIIDKYWNEVRITYSETNDSDYKQVSLFSPHYVVDYLWGSHLTPPPGSFSLDPANNQEQFVSFFSRLNELVTRQPSSPDYIDLSRCLIRNARGPPFNGNLPQLLETLRLVSEGDVLDPNRDYKPTLAEVYFHGA